VLQVIRNALVIYIHHSASGNRNLLVIYTTVPQVIRNPLVICVTVHGNQKPAGHPHHSASGKPQTRRSSAPQSASLVNSNLQICTTVLQLVRYPLVTCTTLLQVIRNQQVNCIAVSQVIRNWQVICTPDSL
jgi:hypothetical protein